MRDSYTYFSNLKLNACHAIYTALTAFLILTVDGVTTFYLIGPNVWGGATLFVNVCQSVRLLLPFLLQAQQAHVIQRNNK